MTTIRRYKHSGTIQMIEDKAPHVGWIRSKTFELPAKVMRRERDGFENGIIDIIMTMTAIEGVGNPPMRGVAARIVDTSDDEDVEKVSGTVYYYTAAELGPKLAHASMNFDHYFEDEEILEPPPKWLDLPQKETDGGQVGENTAGEGSGERPAPEGRADTQGASEA